MRKIMKKITLALVFLNFGMQAQEFPAPYCSISGSGTSTEEITSVVFGDTLITNTDFQSILVNKISEAMTVVPGMPYTLSVQGNTKGDFENKIVAFIDWNQNDILDDEGEIYEVGTITNSTGTDGQIATMTITVPAGEFSGTTRIRIAKIYTDEDSPAIINPCAIEFDAFGQGNFPGYGQALDFTLSFVEFVGTESFDLKALSVYPVPTSEILNISYKDAIDNVKIYNLVGQVVFSENVNSADSQINLSMLAAGNYIVKLSSGELQHNFKVVKL